MSDTNSLDIDDAQIAGEVTANGSHGRAIDPDADLVDDLLHGDGEKAVRELGLRLEKLVCHKYPDFRADADEIVLDILERVYERIGTFGHKSRFFTWVGAIAYNVLKERSRQRKAQGRFEELSEDLVADCLNPEHQVVEALTYEINLLLVDEALKTLTERQREVFLYKHTTDLTSAEIGEKLDMSAGAVRSALVDAHAAVERWRKKKGYSL